MAAPRSRSNLPGMDCDMVQERVAAVRAAASETGCDPVTRARLGVAGARDGVWQSSGTESLGYTAKVERSGLTPGRGHGAIGTRTGHLGGRALTYAARKTLHDKTFEVGTRIRSCRAGGFATSANMTFDAELMFEMTNKIAGDQRPARIADVIVLHS